MNVLGGEARGEGEEEEQGEVQVHTLPPNCKLTHHLVSRKI